MSRFANLVATIENLSESGALGATEDALEAAQTAADVAEGNAEVIKDAGELDNIDTGIEDAFEAQDKIEDLIEAAEETAQNGGMSDKEAKLLEISHESIMSTLGMGHRTTGLSANPVASLESYASAQTRMPATLVTIESLKDSVKNLGGKIIAALKAALSTVVNFVVGLLRNRALMEKHLNNLKAQVEKLDTNKLKQASSEFTTAAAALSVDGKASEETAHKVLDTARKLVAGSITMSATMKTKADSTPAEAVKAVKDIVEGFGANGDGYGNLTSGRKLKVEVKDDTISVTVADGAAKAEKIAAPSKAAMGALLTKAIDIIKALREMSKTETSLKDAVNAIINRLSEYANVVRSKVGSDDSKKKAEQAAAARKSARIARSVMTKAGGTFPALAFAAVKAVADYVTAGLRNFRGEGENGASGVKTDAPLLK